VGGTWVARVRRPWPLLTTFASSTISLKLAGDPSAEPITL
jgi:hypothetical protein